MSAHATHQMHANSLEAFKSLNRKARWKAIHEVYAANRQSLTDREVMTALGFTDANCVRPRITEMIDEGYLCETGKVRDRVTNKPVRICTNTSLRL
jgi:hypothetical protein